MDAELACFLRITFPEHLGQEASVEQVGITDIKFSICCILNTIILYYIIIDCYFLWNGFSSPLLSFVVALCSLLFR